MRIMHLVCTDIVRCSNVHNSVKDILFNYLRIYKIFNEDNLIKGVNVALMLAI